jgi:hypothetical protein
MGICVIQPTFEGLVRYEPDGYFTADVLGKQETVPCTCESSCPHPCIGHCGCEACALHWAFLNDEPSHGEFADLQYVWDPFVPKVEA